MTRPVPLALTTAALMLALAPAAQAVAPVDHPDPGRSPSFALFPTHDDVVAELAAHADHPWLTLHTIGTSSEGRPIQLVEVVDPTSDVPVDERVVTFIFTQQHGNEPAGTPAALDVLDEILSGGPLADALANQVLLLLPMANPDGAEVDQRHNAQDVDVNRDHIGLETPEAQALHEVLARWDVHVAMDHHEYGGVGAGNPVPVRAYDYDLTTLFPVHGNVRGVTLDAARGLMYDGIWPRAQEAGYSANEYGEQTLAGVPVQQVAGGPDPGIMRNHLGLHHVTGLLVETRVDSHPNPFHDAERRTDIHRVVMRATLEYVHDHAATLVDAKRIALADAVDAPFDAYVEGDARGAMPPAFLAAADVDRLMARHGLPTGVPAEGGVVYDVGHDHQGHAAAVLHPASSRHVVDAVPTRALDVGADEAVVPLSQEAPAPPAFASLAFMLLAALAIRRRT